MSSAFSGNMRSLELNAVLVTDHSKLLGRQLRTILSQRLFLCVAQRTGQRRPSEDMSDQEDQI